MNYRYTQKDIKIIDMSNNEADFMYNWIRRHGGRVKMDNVTTDETPICEYSGLPGVESYNDSNTHLDVRDNKNNKENEIHNNNTIQSNEYGSKRTDTK